MRYFANIQMKYSSNTFDLSAKNFQRHLIRVLDIQIPGDQKSNFISEYNKLSSVRQTYFRVEMHLITHLYNLEIKRMVKFRRNDNIFLLIFGIICVINLLVTLIKLS